MTFLITQFLEKAAEEIKYRGLFYQDDELHEVAYSALDTTLAVLNEFITVDGNLYSPKQGWEFPLEYAEVTFEEPLEVAVSVEDETGKIPLQLLKEEQLTELLRFLEIEEEPEVLAKSLTYWMQPSPTQNENGLSNDEEDYYARQTPSYSPPKSGIKTFEELKLIRNVNTAFFDERGTPNETLEALMNMVSLYHIEPININTTSPKVRDFLEKIERVDLPLLAQQLDDEERPQYYTSGTELPQTGLIGFQAKVFKINILANRGDTRFSLSVIAKARGRETPKTDNKEEDKSPSSKSKTGSEKTLPAKNSLDYPFEILRLVENRKIN